MRQRWLSTREAAAVLGVSREFIARLGRTGVLRREAEAVGHRYLAEDVADYCRHRDAWSGEAPDAPDGWLSIEEAADLAGVSDRTILKAARRGLITQRHVPRTYKSLEARSARAWAQEQRAKPKPVPRPPPNYQPPTDDGHDWLDAVAVASMLDISQGRIRELARLEKIPALRVGSRWWFRRDHIEQHAAARARAASQAATE